MALTKVEMLSDYDDGTQVLKKGLVYTVTSRKLKELQEAKVVKGIKIPSNTSVKVK